MKTVGIICEYNPFHLGHAYQIERIREQHAGSPVAIVCLMSGHATQRGELAVADKWVRAATALSCGADVVLELPYPYSAASAAYFAGAGVAVLDALGVDELSFGSECADLPLLERAAQLTVSSEFSAEVAARQKKGEGSARARFDLLRLRLGMQEGAFLANDILAIEYIRAILTLESEMRPVPIRRQGSAYRETEVRSGEYPSATALRALLKTNPDEALLGVPERCRHHLSDVCARGMAPVQMTSLEAAILGFFRLNDPKNLAGIAEMQGGLAGRLCAAARESACLAEMLGMAASKSYPTARLRRAMLFAMTGVTERDLQMPPAYLTLLAADERGRELLRTWKEHAPIPIAAKFADAAAISPAAARQAQLSLALDALFTLALPKPCAADELIKRPPYMQEASGIFRKNADMH